jgi:hypothetical protein
VLDLQAPVHDHRHATVLGDLRALGIDHAELASEGAGTDRHRFPVRSGQGVRRAEYVHHTDRHGMARAMSCSLFLACANLNLHVQEGLLWTLLT